MRQGRQYKRKKLLRQCVYFLISVANTSHCPDTLMKIRTAHQGEPSSLDTALFEATIENKTTQNILENNSQAIIKRKLK